jgi:uncharacterized protein YigE (DUF2233 family)
MKRNAFSRAATRLVLFVALTGSLAIINDPLSRNGMLAALAQTKYAVKEVAAYQGQGFVGSKTRVGAPLNADIVYLTIRGSRLTPKVIGVTPAAPAGPSAIDALTDQRVHVVVGSAYVETFYPPTPVGLLIVAGRTINPLNKQGMSSVLAVRSGRLALTSKEEYNASRVEGAFQVGPQLVKSAQVVSKGLLQVEPRIVDPKKQFAYSQKVTEEPRATRAFVGFRADGTIVLGVALQPVRLSDLALFLAAKTEFGGLGCSEAVNLCGGGSEVLTFRTGRETQSFGNKSLRQAALLTFLRPGQ